MASFRAKSTRSRGSAGLLARRIQGSRRRLLVAGNKDIFKDTSRISSMGGNAPTADQIDRYSAEELYEISYGGSAFYFESPTFQVQRDSEDQYLLNMTRTINVEASIHECPKCRYNRIIVSQRQLRSGDEGMTTLYRCTRCANEWRRD